MDEFSPYTSELDNLDEANDLEASLLPSDDLPSEEPGAANLTDEEILRQLEPIPGSELGLRSGSSRKLFPKLDERKLTGCSGLPTLLPNRMNIGSEDVYAKLNAFMDVLELWGHQLFPSLKFDDLLYRLEVLGHKRAVKRYLEHMREGLFDKCSMHAQPMWSDADDRNTVLTSSDDYEGNLAGNGSSSAPAVDKEISISAFPAGTVSPPTQLTAEQLQRMEENRKRAEARLLARQKLEGANGRDPHGEKRLSDTDDEWLMDQNGRMLSEGDFLAELGFQS